jgi:hypothetical protein
MAAFMLASSSGRTGFESFQPRNRPVRPFPPTVCYSSNDVTDACLCVCWLFGWFLSIELVQ